MIMRPRNQRGRLGIHAPWVCLWRDSRLLRDLVARDISGRYRGAMGGAVWAFLSPLLMLGVYSFVFGLIFNSRWTSQETGEVHFSIVLFIGLIVANFLSDCLNRAPGLIVANANYVKKVVFPVDLLPAVVVGSALFHAAIAFVVLMVVMAVTGTPFAATAVLMPLVFMIFVPMVLGLSWAFAALGVYLRDLQQFVGVLATALMFLAPVFYPRSMLPEQYQWVVVLNPLTFVVETSRGILLWSQVPDWSSWLAYALASCLVGWAGWLIFQITRRGFADVI